MSKNYFITLEGIEGAGKTTIANFIGEFLTDNGVEFAITREPGGTPIAEAIRKILLDHHHEIMCADTEVLLFFASRAQHLETIIKPALKAGKWIICDRFTDATYAYQGAGHKVTKERIAIIEEWVQQGLKPDLTLILDIDPVIGLNRARTKGEFDRIESEEVAFFQRVREQYLTMDKSNPQRYKIINAEQPLSLIKQQLCQILHTLLSAD
jgi:dTMP kinase